MKEEKLRSCFFNKGPHIFILHWALLLLDEVGKLRHKSPQIHYR